MQLTVTKLQKINTPITPIPTQPSITQQHGIQQIKTIHNIFNNRQNKRYLS